MKRLFVIVVCVVAVPVIATSQEYGRAKTRRPFGKSAEDPPNQFHKYQEDSWISVPNQEPPIIKINDIITILVDEKATQNQQRQFNSQKNGTYKVELKEFLRLNDAFNLANAALNSPKIDSTLNSRLQASGRQKVQESTKFRIAATVVDTLPNGNLVVEARKTIRSDRDVWSYQLTGIVPVRLIEPDGTVKSENIADLDIVKNTLGKVRDSTRRGWLIRLIDWLGPL